MDEIPEIRFQRIAGDLADANRKKHNRIERQKRALRQLGDMLAKLKTRISEITFKHVSDSSALADSLDQLDAIEQSIDHSETALKYRIHQIALKHAGNYPDIGIVKPREQLYAIECGLEGQDAALKDWYRMAEHMGRLLWGDQWKEKMLEAWEQLALSADQP